MAAYCKITFLVCFLVALGLSCMDSAVAARHLLQQTQTPAVPTLPQPTFPTIPNMPKVTLPPLPSSLPKPAGLPPLPSLPKVSATFPTATLPPLPAAILSNTPAILAIPTTVPAFPFPFLSPPPSTSATSP
uniref:Uncharacterized protein n=1 Tax=Kalanchoe fedtschenkoi TaxID=63787 RepID=A0A7N0VGU0_KALFE